jgi:hypothetical protein
VSTLHITLYSPVIKRHDGDYDHPWNQLSLDGM